MKKIMIVVLIFAVVLIVGGILGSILSNDRFETRFSGSNIFRGNMMFGTYDADREEHSDRMDIDELIERAEDYINNYDEKLVISDIFVFKDSDYYFSIVEQDTGLGAMELLVNPYTGDVQPEFGPNMMWNLKYGMHGGSSYGMMGNRSWSMMGRNTRRFSSSGYDDYEANTVIAENAKQLASDYLEKNTKDYLVSDDFHEFYGYYTFHIEDADKTVGMLSVNGLSGEVWYHDWHGTVEKIIGGHNENDEH